MRSLNLGRPSKNSIPNNLSTDTFHTSVFPDPQGHGSRASTPLESEFAKLDVIRSTNCTRPNGCAPGSGISHPGSILCVLRYLAYGEPALLAREQAELQYSLAQTGQGPGSGDSHHPPRL
jgi:hypothetical protein